MMKTEFKCSPTSLFLAFANTKDHVFYGAWNIAEAIGEVMVEKNKRSLSEVTRIRLGSSLVLAARLKRYHPRPRRGVDVAETLRIRQLHVVKGVLWLKVIETETLQLREEMTVRPINRSHLQFRLSILSIILSAH